MEQILQSFSLGTLRGRFEAQRIEPQAVLNLIEKKFGKKNSGKKFEKKFEKNFGKSFDKKFFPNFFFKIFS